MVMRQNFQTEEHLNNYIELLDSFKDKADKRISEGVNEIHRKRLLYGVFDRSVLSLITKYSVGRDIESLSYETFSLIKNLEAWLDIGGCFKIEDALELYISCLHCLSFCYFFNVPRDKVQIIADHISLTGKDWLIDRLIAASIPTHPIAVGKLAFPKVYQPLADALSYDQTTEARTKKVQLFLKNYYPLLKKHDVTWHDSHKEPDPEYCIHFGYWIFELGALAADIGWDDSAYRDHEMYPKDLVDWKFSQRPKDEQNKI